MLKVHIRPHWEIRFNADPPLDTATLLGLLLGDPRQRLDRRTPRAKSACPTAMPGACCAKPKACSANRCWKPGADAAPA